MSIDKNPSRNDWNIETLRQLFIMSLDDFKLRYDDGRRDQELRLQQRFEASEKAIAASSQSAREAVSAALAAAERSVVSALAAAEKAIDKAEVAQHAHNVAQTEWHGQVNDATRAVAENARHEAQTLVAALSERVDISITALTEQVNRNADGLNKSEGRTIGTSSSLTMTIAADAVVVALISAAISFYNSQPLHQQQQYIAATTHAP
jgi:hypothetical protein